MSSFLEWVKSSVVSLEMCLAMKPLAMDRGWGLLMLGCWPFLDLFAAVFERASAFSFGAKPVCPGIQSI